MAGYVYIPVLMLYAWLTVAHLLPSWVGEKGQERVRIVAIAAAIVHVIGLTWSVFDGGVHAGIREGLSATSLGVMVAFAWVGTGRIQALGMLAAPMSMVLLGTSMVVPPHGVQALAETGYSPWLPIHLALIFAGIGGFALASLVGVAYLWVRSRLKQKKLAGIQRLPSLEVLDRMQFRAMLFGFVFLTLGIGAGGIWAAASLSGDWEFDPKVWATLLIWFWYGVALQFRLVAGRRGRWTALFSIVGFAGLLFSLVGVNLLVSGWHGYG